MSGQNSRCCPLCGGVGFRLQGSRFRVEGNWAARQRFANHARAVPTEEAHPPGCARCGAGADCSAIEFQSLHILLDVKSAVLALIVQQSNTNLFQGSRFRVEGYRATRQRLANHKRAVPTEHLLEVGGFRIGCRGLKVEGLGLGFRVGVWEPHGIRFRA